MSDKNVFILTFDEGGLEDQASILVNSIINTYDNSKICAFVPDSSEISSDIENLIKERGKVVRGKNPIPEYPIANLIKAAKIGSREFPESRYIILDTDTVIFSELELSAGTTMVRPVPISTTYWASQVSEEDWEELTEKYNKKRTRKITTDIDKKTIPEYYNSGVVVTENENLATEWMDITKDMLSMGFEDQKRFFIDQVSLTLALLDKKVETLSRKDNYLLEMNFTIPLDVRLLHYGSFLHLNRASGILATKLSQYGFETRNLSRLEKIYLLLDVLSAQSSRVLTYKMRQIIRSSVKTLLNY